MEKQKEGRKSRIRPRRRQPRLRARLRRRPGLELAARHHPARPGARRPQVDGLAGLPGLRRLPSAGGCGGEEADRSRQSGVGDGDLRRHQHRLAHRRPRVLVEVRRAAHQQRRGRRPHPARRRRRPSRPAPAISSTIAPPGATRSTREPKPSATQMCPSASRVQPSGATTTWPSSSSSELPDRLRTERAPHPPVGQRAVGGDVEGGEAVAPRLADDQRAAVRSDHRAVREPQVLGAPR